MIIVARHGRTQWNAEHRLQGSQDSPLTVGGQDQATRLGNFIKRNDLTHVAIYSSPLGRCVHTLELAGFDTDKAVFIPGLQECSFGLLEGMIESEAKDLFPDYYEARAKCVETKWLLAPPGGESYSDVSLRVRQALAQIDLNQDVLIMTHGFTSRIVRGLLVGATYQEILGLPKQANNEIYCIENQVEEVIKL